MSDSIRVILFQEADRWVAQGLEHDICVQAETLDELYGRFDVTARLESEEEGGIERIAPAPKHFFDLWERKSGDYIPSEDSDSNYSFALAA